MHDLTLVGVHDDGEHLVLVDAQGQRYRVPVDEQLRAAARRDRARLGQLQIQSENRIRPRDIQARVRAGQAAEEIAAAAGVPVEHVRRYEGPVLAEREHVALQARRVRVRRTGTAAAPTLEDLVAERLEHREVSADALAWDAWRMEDGSWTVQLTFPAGSKQRRARWFFDLVLLHLVPTDDEARWLTDGEVAQPPSGPGLRLAGTREKVYDVEADGGVRAAEQEGEQAGAPAPGGRPRPSGTDAPSGTLALLENLRSRRGRRHAPDPQEQAAPGADEASLLSRSQVLGEPPAAHPPLSQVASATDAEVLDLPEADQPAAAAELADTILGPRGGPGHVPVDEGRDEPADRSGAQAGDGQETGEERGQETGWESGQETGEGTGDAQAEAADRTDGRTDERRDEGAGDEQADGGEQAGDVERAGDVEQPAAAEGEQTLLPDVPAAAAAKPAGNRRRNRASVPSWDDIVFGARRE